MEKFAKKSVARINGKMLSLIGAAAMSVCGVSLASPQNDDVAAFSQRLLVTGQSGDGVCANGSRWSTEDWVCHPAEVAPNAAQRSLVVTTSGHAFGSLVVTNDGFGSGRPTLAVPVGECPVGAGLLSGAAQQIGAKAEFVITPAQGGAQRIVSTVIAQPQAAKFLRQDHGRAVYDLPALDQPLASAEPVDLGQVKAGDKVELRLLATGDTASCVGGMLQHQALEAGLWGQSSTETTGYLSGPMKAASYDDTKVAPFKAIAIVSY